MFFSSFFLLLLYLSFAHFLKLFFPFFLENIAIKTEPIETNEMESETTEDQIQRQPQIRVSNFASQSAGSTNLVNVINQLQQKQNDSHETIINDITDVGKKDSVSMWIKTDNSNSNSSPTFITDIKNTSSEVSPNSSFTSPSSGSGQKSLRRRIRRKHNSPDDQAEALTEMSVRGLNLFRYASIQDGVYKCTECAKESVQKTFKNKYSFQRHAFLYHEGTQRKVFPCPVCRKEFSRPDKMKNHMKMTHDCYMPKECKFPLPLITAGTSQSAPINNNILNLATTQ
jgi:C2H2-type zinc finger